LEENGLYGHALARNSVGNSSRLKFDYEANMAKQSPHFQGYLALF
jgi:hypothetical protein